MTSSVNQNQQKITTLSENNPSATRLGVSSTIGAGLSALVTFGMGTLASPQFVNQLPGQFALLTSLTSLTNPLAIAGVAAAGLFAGALIGRATSANVDQVKQLLNIEGSDLNSKQMDRVANVALNGGLFQSRTITVEFKDDVARMQNLNSELTRTEKSLSADAHTISKARGTEARFFDLEGKRLAHFPKSTSQFIETLSSLKLAINSVVNATDQYTSRQGDSLSAASRRDYMLASIFDFAYQNGVAGTYLTAAVKEYVETAKSDVKLATENLKDTLQQGIQSGILSPEVDARFYEGMVNAAVEASQASKGVNPDSIISSFFDVMKGASLIDAQYQARFIKDVRARLVDATVDILDPTAPPTGKPSILEKFANLFKPAPAQGNPQEESVLKEEALPAPAVAPVETPAQKKQREKEEARMQADIDVQMFASEIGKFQKIEQELRSRYTTISELISQKRKPLSKVLAMGKGELRAAVWQRHTENLDLLEHFNEHDAEIGRIDAEIENLMNDFMQIKIARPANFKLASKEQRKIAEQIESQFKSAKSELIALDKQLFSAWGSLRRDVEQHKKEQEKLLAPATETSLPQPNLPAQPQQPGIFSRFFKKSEKVAEENEVVIEKAFTGNVQTAAGVEETPAVSDDTLNRLAADELPEIEELPAVAPQKKWF